MAAERSGVDNYDVFINFRGADTRQGNFVNRLYEEFVAEGIRVFLDDKELKYGKRLDEELPQAINNSKTYIAVFSETYASSKWCLRELAEIVRNKQQYKEKKEILPVFYKIKADDVKLKTDLFNSQLNSLLEEKKARAETIEEWAMALKAIPEVRGWTVPIHGGYKQDVECCREIVKRALIILRVKHKSLPKDLIGIEDPTEEVMQLLDMTNLGLQIIGIHGMGGSGKTTLAKAVYNKLCDRFDRYCFLDDVRESLDKDKGSRGCLDLQKKLLKEISFRGPIDEITDVDDAERKIQLTLQGKKVLMVFDDVSKSEQIVSLICNNGDMSMLDGSGSRIIITTRNDRVLQIREFMGFTKIHKMKTMENEHALELFSWHAFGKETPPEDFAERSKDAVSLTGRLPLSLKITGSLFFTRGRKNWWHTLEKLKKMPNENIQKRLKISYDDLEERTREIFRDIACFFVDRKRSHEVTMWNACDFVPELAVEELISMCLVKIDDDGIYRMHDHIKDLGREIVRQEEQCSRIWQNQDVMDILSSSRIKENIEGILFKRTSEKDERLIFGGKNCVNFERLRLLHLDGFRSTKTKYFEVQLEGSFAHICPNLRWLSLKYLKMKRFHATSFNLKKLVVLDLSDSDILVNWAGWKLLKDLPSLEVLNLTSCRRLKKTPDLSYNTSLKELYLHDCQYLEEIDCSITSLRKLQHLDLSGCWRLKKLPDSIGELVELEVLLLVGCSSLVSLPNSLTTLPKLHILRLFRCTSLESLPDSVGGMVQLTELDISYLVRLNKLPGFIFKQKKLEVLRGRSLKIDGVVPTEIGELTCLKEISFKRSDFCGLPSLVKLTCLEILSLSCCHLRQLPELPTSLVELHVSSFYLQSIPDYSYLIHLTVLKLDVLCQWEVSSWFDQWGELQQLNVNWIWRLPKLKRLHSTMPTNFTTTIQSEESTLNLLSKLEELTLSYSVLGTCVIPYLSALRRLEISLYKGTTSLSLPRLNRLMDFTLYKSEDVAQIHGLGELESLVTLEIKRCNSLERLDDISKLRKLVTLAICYCKKLRVISLETCQPSLKRLTIDACELLESLVGHSEESESKTKNFLEDLHRLGYLNIKYCPLLENKLSKELLDKISESRRSDGDWRRFVDLFMVSGLKSAEKHGCSVRVDVVLNPRSPSFQSYFECIRNRHPELHRPALLKIPATVHNSSTTSYHT